MSKEKITSLSEVRKKKIESNIHYAKFPANQYAWYVITKYVSKISIFQYFEENEEYNESYVLSPTDAKLRERSNEIGKSIEVTKKDILVIEYGAIPSHELLRYMNDFQRIIFLKENSNIFCFNSEDILIKKDSDDLALDLVTTMHIRKKPLHSNKPNDPYWIYLHDSGLEYLVYRILPLIYLFPDELTYFIDDNLYENISVKIKGIESSLSIKKHKDNIWAIFKVENGYYLYIVNTNICALERRGFFSGAELTTKVIDDLNF